MKIISIDYPINDEVDEALEQLLKVAKDYVHPDSGERPYKDCDKDKMFHLAMEFGGSFNAIKQINFLKRLIGGEA